MVGKSLQRKAESSDWMRPVIWATSVTCGVDYREAEDAVVRMRVEIEVAMINWFAKPSNNYTLPQTSLALHFLTFTHSPPLLYNRLLHPAYTLSQHIIRKASSSSLIQRGTLRSSPGDSNTAKGRLKLRAFT